MGPFLFYGIFIGMKNLIKHLLRENLQLADKFYFKDGKLSPRVREIILHLTNGDPYTKIMTDIYYTMLMNGHRTGDWALKAIDPEHQETEKPQNDVMGTPDLQKLRPIYNQLKEYNKNVFPIKGFNINGVEDINDFIWALKQRQLILDVFKTLPSIASRNMKSDIRLERDGSEMNHYRDELVSVHAYLSALTNRDEETQRKILGKIFKKDTSLENVYDFVIDKQNLIGGVDMTRKQIGQILKKDREEYGELKVKLNRNDIMIIEVTGPNGIKEIGCNSLWCFTYNSRHGGLNWQDWQNNSTNGYCYIIINFSEPSDSPDFMYVLTKPLDAYDDTEDDYSNGGHMLFDMSNDEMEDPIHTIESMIDYPTAVKVMNFGIKPVKPKKKKFVDPNQLVLDLNENIKKILRENN